MFLKFQQNRHIYEFQACKIRQRFWKLNWHLQKAVWDGSSTFKTIAGFFGSSACECLLGAGVGSGWWSLCIRVFGLLKRIRTTHTYSLAMDPGVHQQLNEVPIWVPSSLWSLWYFLVPSISSSLARRLLLPLCLHPGPSGQRAERKVQWGLVLPFWRQSCMGEDHLPKFWLPQALTASSGCCHHHGIAGVGKRIQKNKKTQRVSTLSWVYEKCPLYSLRPTERACACLCPSTPSSFPTCCLHAGVYQRGKWWTPHGFIGTSMNNEPPPAVVFRNSTHSQLYLVLPYLEPVQLVFLMYILYPHCGPQTHDSEIQEPHFSNWASQGPPN